MPITTRSGRTVTLGDVADVADGTWPLIGDAVINDGPGLMLVVEKYPWANTLELTQGVEQALDELRPGLPGLEMDPSIFQAADFIDLAVHNLARALILGSMLVLLVLGLFLFEWRTALISLVAIPLSLLTAALILDARGRNDQHDGPHRHGDRRRGGGRRRDHRYREHRPAPAASRGRKARRSRRPT